MSEVVIVGAARTAIGSFGGALSSLSAAELGKVAIEEALKRSQVAGQEVDEVVLGQVLTAAAGMNPARQASMAAGIPQEKTAMTINQV
ncbi:MAG: acetyl-CoA C-acyltransferase, partial [Pseudomonadota bacterium]|nr:acetyl-CoA C-acyltransferase [Pseudomonadota bacterium]